MAYWSNVRAALLEVIVPWSVLRNTEVIILTGDMARGKFLQVLEETVEDQLRTILPVLSDDDLVVAAKGAA